MSKLSKNQLLSMIKKLEKNPEDKVRILGDAGITLVGVGLGAAAAGTVAGAVGATSIFGITSAAGLFGISVVGSTPIGWIIGVAAFFGGVAYGISRLIHNGGLAEGRKKELLQKYHEEINTMETKERANSISESDKTNFIISIKDLINKNVISAEDASELIEHVQTGVIPVSQGYAIVENILKQTA